VIDPLGGSYYVEALTTDYERRIFDILEEVDERGGTIRLIEQGMVPEAHRGLRLRDGAAQAVRREAGDRREPLRGGEAQHDIEIHPYDPTTAERQVSRTRRIRRERDNARVNALLDQLVSVARDDSQNIMPITIELVKAGATMGDIVEKLKGLWGTYRETPVF